MPYAIGQTLGRASSTIRNELERGTVTQVKASKKITVYLPDAGQMTYERNRMNCRRISKFLLCHSFIEYVEDCIWNLGHSTDAICGRTRLDGSFHPDEMVCTKTFYNYVDIGLMKVKNIDLPQKVKRSTKSKRKRKHKKIYGMSISKRPENINNRSEFGHWEIDSVIGKKCKGEAVMTALHRLADDSGGLFP